jgi:hypothetical protein
MSSMRVPPLLQTSQGSMQPIFAPWACHHDTVGCRQTAAQPGEDLGHLDMQYETSYRLIPEQ